jgi:hypothetical protein
MRYVRVYEVLGEKSTEKRRLERRRWENNIKNNIKEIDMKAWIGLTL